MQTDEIIHYMSEFRRILKPTGRVWASCFLINDDLLDAIRSNDKPKWNLSFRHPYADGCYVNSKDEPRGAVAFDQEVFRDMISRGGLALDQILWGEWSGQRQAPKSGQDVAILMTP